MDAATRLPALATNSSGAVVMQDLFRFEQTGVDSQGGVLGDLAPTGVRPTFADTFETAGSDFNWGTLAASS